MKYLLYTLAASLFIPQIPARAGELVLKEPLDFQVVQRTEKERGTIPISGEFKGDGGPVVSLEARLSSGGTAGEWKRLTAEIEGVRFSTKMEAPSGGWYRLELRVSGEGGGEVLGETAVEHVGIGEIFVVAGQSNSANHGEERQVTKTGRVANFDGRAWRPANDPQPGASGGGGSFLPPFGDAMAERFDVPIGLIACGIGATSVREWLPEGATFPNPPTIESRVRKLPGGNWASKGAAYKMFVGRTKQLGVNGFRAVLWHQGESDANQRDATRTLPGKLYREYLEKVIRDSRREIGWDVPWFVAQVSYHVPGDESSADIRAGQASLWKDGVAEEGPDSDALKGELRERGGKGSTSVGRDSGKHGQLWAEKVSAWLGRELEK